MIPPCLTLSDIRYIWWVKWSNPGKRVAPSPTPQCSSYWKESLLVSLDYGHQLIYIYIYIWLTMVGGLVDWVLRQIKSGWLVCFFDISNVVDNHWLVVGIMAYRSNWELWLVGWVLWHINLIDSGWFFGWVLWHIKSGWQLLAGCWYYGISTWLTLVG